METSHILYCEKEGELIKIFLTDTVNKDGLFFYFTVEEAVIISDLLKKVSLSK